MPLFHLPTLLLFMVKRFIRKPVSLVTSRIGQGISGAYPPLAGSDYLLANKYRAIHQVIKGSSGAIAVSGSTFNGIMPPQPLKDTDIAAALNYVYHSWGNKGFHVSALEVKKVRDTIK